MRPVPLLPENDLIAAGYAARSRLQRNLSAVEDGSSKAGCKSKDDAMESSAVSSRCHESGVEESAVEAQIAGRNPNK